MSSIIEAIREKACRNIRQRVREVVTASGCDIAAEKRSWRTGAIF
jgi:hypothetical protein